MSTILFPFGGGVAEYAADVMAIANRDAAHIFFAAGCWPREDEGGASHIAWAWVASEAIGQ